MWKSIMPAMLGACLLLGLRVPSAAEGTLVAPSASQGARLVTIVVVPVAPAVIYVGNIPILVSTHQVVVVRGEGRVVLVPHYGPFYLNGVPVAVLRPTQVVVVDAPG